MDERAPQGCGCHDEVMTCTSISAQYADVSLPVKVKPYAVVGDVQTNCQGEPVVSVRQTCAGCEITITQSLCITIPIEYGTTVEAGEPTVSCRRAPAGGCAPCR